MDFFIVRAFLESIKRGVTPPIDVYDAVSMSVISPLSEKSIARREYFSQISRLYPGKMENK